MNAPTNLRSGKLLSRGNMAELRLIAAVAIRKPFMLNMYEGIRFNRHGLACRIAGLLSPSNPYFTRS